MTFLYPGKNNDFDKGTRNENRYLFRRYDLLGFCVYNTINNYDINDLLYLIAPTPELCIESQYLRPYFPRLKSG